MGRGYEQVVGWLTANAETAASSFSGPLGNATPGSWTALFNSIKAVIPQARVNSAYRPGDPGAHGRNKAVDFGFGTGPGGAGSAGLASINRLLHDQYGGQLYELIYDGIGDDRPDIKSSRPHTYSQATQDEHDNHVHAAVYKQGTDYVPYTGMALLHQGEAVVPTAHNQGAPWSGARSLEAASPVTMPGYGAGFGGANGAGGPVNVTVENHYYVDGQELKGMARTEATTVLTSYVQAREVQNRYAGRAG
jgi:hypothetical protein